MKTAVLIQAHSDIDHYIAVFNANKDVNFYIHIDKKNQSLNLKVKDWDFDNVSVIDNPVKVYWGGYSQLLATLSLIKRAYSNVDNTHFHLISGECIPLIKFNKMNAEWVRNGNCLYMESLRRSDLDWRLNVKAPHSDTFLLRTFIGRVFNKLLKLLGNNLKLTSFDSNEYAFGSQWFSFTRRHASTILEYEKMNYFMRFKKISCADEHAFQMLFKKTEENMCGNKRYIVFEYGKSSPRYVTKTELKKAKENGFWFARKVKENTFKEYFDYDL